MRHHPNLTKRSQLSLLAAATALAIVVLIAPTAQAQTRGLVVDRQNSAVVLFDADNDVSIGSVHLPTQPYSIQDCVISKSQNVAFINDYLGHAIWVIDLATLDLDGGVNPIPVSLGPLDLTLTADERHIIASGGASSHSVSVAGTAERFEVSSLAGVDIQSVEACEDNSVLATSMTTHESIRLTLDETGELTMNESVSMTNAFNAACVPGDTVGFTVNTMADDQMACLHYPPLEETDTIQTASSPVSVAVASKGDRVYVRSTEGSVGRVTGYALDSATGTIASEPAIEISTFAALLYYGVDQMAIHPDDGKIYVPEGNAVRVFDTATGQLLASIEHPDLRDTVGVCLVDDRPDSLAATWDLMRCSHPNQFNCKSGTMSVVPATIYGSADLDVDQIDFSTLRLALASDPTETTGPAMVLSSPFDVGSPADLDNSSCFGPFGTLDGLADVEVQFSGAELAELIGCGNLGSGASSDDLVIIGAYYDGTPIIADNTQFVVNTASGFGFK